MQEHERVRRHAAGGAAHRHPPRPAGKLVVGRADDPLEAEADRIADQVMQSLRTGGADLLARSADRTTRIRRHAGHAGHAGHDHHGGPEVGLAGGAISAELDGKIRSASGGRPLGAETLQRMEAGFGASFGDVRIHADSPLPSAMAAHAFTTGRDIHFAPGLYSPSTTGGERLLAHELTHVVQQGGAVARHLCDSYCGHGVDTAGPTSDELVAGIAPDITVADTGGAVRRHSSWEHMLIGDLEPESLATLGAQQDVQGLPGGATVNIGTTALGAPILVNRDDVKHVIEQEINRLRTFQAAPPMVGSARDVGQREQQMKTQDAQDRALAVFQQTGDMNAAQAEAGRQWDLKLVGVPNNSGVMFLVTYGEMNTLGDYFGSIEEMKAVDPAWMDKLIRGVRQSTLRELVKVYALVSGFTDDHRKIPTTNQNTPLVSKTKESKAMDALGLAGDSFKSTGGDDDAVPLGGVLNELRLMGVAPGGSAKPLVNGDASTDYASSLARNACHFAPESWHAWAGFHEKARVLALQAWNYTQQADQLEAAMALPGYQGDVNVDRLIVEARRDHAATAANEAMLNNGFGDHYLQDSYAAGHLINKTLIMQQYVKWLDKNPGKWDAHRDKNWRVMQQMAYGQSGLTDRAQYDPANVGNRQVRGQTVESGHNPQTVENITGGWQVKAEALGLVIPPSLTNPDARTLLQLWQTKCVTHARIRNPRVQEWKTIKRWAQDAHGMNAARTLAAMSRLFEDGIVRKDSYKTSDRVDGYQHTLQPGTKLTLRDEYVPSSAQNLHQGMHSQQTYNDMALGIAYDDYLEFMNSAFLQKATNFVHDKFCLEGLDVQEAGGNHVFRIYGDDSMFKTGAAEGLRHSGTTAKMSRNAIVSIVTTGAAGGVTTRNILDRLPAEVDVGGGAVALDQWHHGALLTQLEATIFDSMSEAGNVLVNKLVVGAKPGLKGAGLLGTITSGGRPGGHEVF